MYFFDIGISWFVELAKTSPQIIIDLGNQIEYLYPCIDLFNGGGGVLLNNMIVARFGVLRFLSSDYSFLNDR